MLTLIEPCKQRVCRSVLSCDTQNQRQQGSFNATSQCNLVLQTSWQLQPFFEASVLSILGTSYTNRAQGSSVPPRSILCTCLLPGCPSTSKVASSPTWHRQQRKQRQRARHRQHRCEQLGSASDSLLVLTQVNAGAHTRHPLDVKACKYPC